MTRSVEIPIEAVDAAYYVLTAHGHGGSECEPQPGLDGTARAALVAARPYLMPTRETIKKALIGKPIIRSNDKASWWRGGLGPEEIDDIAEIIAALLNGES